MTALPREWYRGPQFASDADRRKWEPVLRAAAALWDQLEVLSVASGVRSSALLYLTPEEVVRSTEEAAENAFNVVPLQVCGDKVRAAVCPASLRSVWVAAWKARDDSAIGRLLGFPDCCVRYFAETWAKGNTDTVTTLATVEGPPEANVLLRHLGVRLVPHLPCSASCPGTISLGERIAAAGVAAGLDLEPLYRVLRLQVQYNAVHGVAITETPHFRFLSGSDQTAALRSASRPAAPDPEPQSWEDNGFKTAAGMAAAHAVVLGVVGRVASALDLGAGDGALLSRIASGRPGRWVGVELDGGRVLRGVGRHPEVALVRGRIEDHVPPEPLDVVVLMPGRLLEMGASAAAVRARIPAAGRRLVVYTYGDHGDLAALCARAGLEVVGDVAGTPGGTQAAEGRI